MRSTAAKAAAMIRKEIKKNGIKARVTCQNYSGGSSINVVMNDELPATYDKIEEYAKQFQFGHFNGMTDSYEYSNTRDDIPQVTFVFVDNRYSDKVRASAWEYCLANHSDATGENLDMIAHHERIILSQLMNGDWGTWLSSRKVRATA
jgi:hypothetical protein